MACLSQKFNQVQPQAPALTKGMRLSANGISCPPLQMIGNTLGASGAPGKFSDQQGGGQIAGALGTFVVGDFDNQRFQSFKKDLNGLYQFDSQVGIVTVTGAVDPFPHANIVAVDPVRQELHLGSWRQVVTGTHIGVWGFSPTNTLAGLTVGNRLRSYGTNGTSGSASGKTILGQSLFIAGDDAILASAVSDRMVRRDHISGGLLAEVIKPAAFALASDGTNWWFISQASLAEPGLWRFNPATLIGTTRLDTNNTVQGSHRRGRFRSGIDVQAVGAFGGRVYARSTFDGRIMGWDTANAFVDDFLLPGGSLSGAFLGASGGGVNLNSGIGAARFGFCSGVGNQSDDFLIWLSTGPNDFIHDFIGVVPLSIATATWAFDGWSTSTNTLTQVALRGKNLAAEKCRVRIKKNADPFVTIPWDKLDDTATLGLVGTLTDGDQLTVEVSLSVWDRLDGDASLVAVRDHLAPEDVVLTLYWDDPGGDILVPYASAAFKGKVAPTAALKGRIDG